MISKADVEHVALLARFELDEEEKDKYAAQLNDILEFAQKLNELDTDNIPPTTHVLPLKNVFREDETGEHMDREKALANAPEKEDGYFKVPSIL